MKIFFYTSHDNFFVFVWNDNHEFYADATISWTVFEEKVVIERKNRESHDDAPTEYFSRKKGYCYEQYKCKKWNEQYHGEIIVFFGKFPIFYKTCKRTNYSYILKHVLHKCKICMAPHTHLTVEFCGVDFRNRTSKSSVSFQTFGGFFMFIMLFFFKQKQSWQNIWHHFLSHWR